LNISFSNRIPKEGTMTLRIFFLGFALLCASGEAFAEPIIRPPAELAVRVIANEFDPGDFAWARGRFDGRRRQMWQNAVTWARERQQARLRDVSLSLTQLGITSHQLEPGCFGEEVCEWIVRTDAIAAQFRDWPSFEAAVAEATPVFLAYRSGVSITSLVYAPAGQTFLENIRANQGKSQSMRIGAAAMLQGEPHIRLTSGGVRVLNLLMLMEAVRADRSGAMLLQQQLVSGGWPQASVVGEANETLAFMTVQHADHDPALQLRVLRLVEPLVATGQMRPQLYAYLYDRVMLKIAGVQRYGTQDVRCDGARAVAPNLESGRDVERDRASVSLSSLSDYARAMGLSCGGP
jgi:hypothetical protein